MQNHYFYWNNFWSKDGENVPWETNEVDESLISFLNDRQFSSVLEFGCGSGINLLMMAKKGMRCTGIDISEVAIEFAKRRDIHRTVDFRVEDVFLFSTDDRYDLIFDRGCFHGFSSVIDRHNYVKKVNELLSNDGKWFSLIGSAENVQDNFGPPRHTLLQVVSCIEPYLKIEEVQECEIKNKGGIMSPGWKITSSKRKVPINKSF